MKKQLKSKTNRRHKHRKNCSCKGKRKMRGGSTNDTIIPLNNYMNDPLSPSMQLSGRNIPGIKGGRKRRNITPSKRFKGGNPISNPMLYGATNNMLTNFGNSDMAYFVRDLVSGQPLPSTDVIDQPAFSTYNKYNPPLV